MTSLYYANVPRKYLTPSEREVFLKTFDDQAREVRTFCHTLACAGCRISDALVLTADRGDFKGGLTRQAPLLNMVQKWLGHAQLTATAIYAKRGQNGIFPSGWKEKG